MQNELQAIYELEMDHSVHDFLITNGDIARSLDSKFTDNKVKERLLICQDGDNLDVSLYLEKTILHHLQQDDPVNNLHAGNINDFCLILEGVSHLVYLLWNAGFDRCVTQLEMELQAEIDKFFIILFLLDSQNRICAPELLQKVLFDSVSYHEHLEQKELQRYRDANFYAAKYCRRLQENINGRKMNAELLKELRRFYRMPQQEKLRHINH